VKSVLICIKLVTELDLFEMFQGLVGYEQRKRK